jgi:hypothetical protein
MAEMMSRSGAFDAITMAAVAPGVRRPTPARTSVIPTSVCVMLSNLANIPSCVHALRCSRS